jgi:hypothetical protein
MTTRWGTEKLLENFSVPLENKSNYSSEPNLNIQYQIMNTLQVFLDLFEIINEYS